jgi:aryl-alcohol dehydrogenase-like predicted oxidoreductase
LSRNNKIGLGTVQFGLPYGINNLYGQTTKEEVGIILQTAAEKGITIIDTARAYGNSESVLGEQNLNQFDIVSKFTANASDGLNEQLADSLRRLNTKCMYAYLSHSVENLIENPQLIDTLNELKQKSIVTKIGCSFNHSSEVEMIQRIGFKPDLIQIPFNIF